MGEQIMSVVGPTGRILVPIALGLLLRAVGLFGDEEGALLRKFVVRFTVPLFVFFSVYEARPESVASILPMAAAFLLMTAALFLVGWAASAPFRAPHQKTAVHACVTFGNYGWMGLGVAHALLGEPGSQRVVYFFLLWWPAFYAFGLTIGLIHVGRRRGAVPLRDAAAIALPPIVALGVGLALNLAAVPVPGFVALTLRPFGEMTVPLILLSLGMMLDFRRLGREVKPALLVSALTLVVGPLIGWGLAALLARDPVSFRVIILEGAMPVATLTPLLEENYAMDKDLVSTAIVLSTLLCLVTVPVVAALTAV
jgi:hypothetical protein